MAKKLQNKHEQLLLRAEKSLAERQGQMARQHAAGRVSWWYRHVRPYRWLVNKAMDYR